MGDKKVDIQSSKVDIESLLADKVAGFSEKTIAHIYKMFDKFGFDVIFGRGSSCRVAWTSEFKCFQVAF